MAAPTLHTPRLLLRPHRADDFDAYAALWSEPAVVRFIGGAPVSREAAWARFLLRMGMWHAVGFGFFALEDRATGAFVGEAGFQELRRALTPSIENTLEAGWVLSAVVQGRGFAEEAMRAALAWADGRGTGSRVTCIIDPGNAASLRVAGKLGFVETARPVYRDGPVVMLERGRPTLAP